MEYLKKDSAKANHFRRQFESIPTRSLTDCYRKPSHTKEQIWNTLSLECAMKCGFFSQGFILQHVSFYRSFCLSRSRDGSLSYSSQYPYS